MCLSAGMNDYLSKPVDPDALAEVLDTWLPEGKEEGGGLNGEPAAGQAGDAPPSEVPIWDQAGMWDRLMDDEELAGIVLNGFLEDIPRQVEALRDVLPSTDHRETERLAHTIKGASANVGGERLRWAAADLEKALRNGDLNTLGRLFASLEEEHVQLRAAMGVVP